MKFIDEIKHRAKNNLKTIVLPEGNDIRVLKAAEQITIEGFAKVILVGNESEILNLANNNGINVNNIKIVDPKKSENYKKYVNDFFELRQKKGMTIQKAEELMLDSVYYGMMMVKNNEADGLVSGAAHSTADTLRPALQILKTDPEAKLVSAFFLMNVPDCSYGEEGIFVFSDCGLNENPTAEELCEIAHSSSKSFELLTGKKSKIAMLSYSTYGSARSESTEKMLKAAELVKHNYPDLVVDGELQLDAAIIPEVSKIKAPNSVLNGQANTLIFPNLDAGNIGYKLTQRFAKAEAYGPLCQGIAKPVNDLSRGCSSDDIVGVVAITCVQCQVI